jgi:general secretion pathway protein A
MYTSFFGLSEKPFAITPDPRYLYLSERHAEALAHLLYGINESGGFIQLTGEVGTGKTTMVRTLLSQLPQHADVAVILNPRVTPAEFLLTICEELGVALPPEDRDSVKQMVDALNRRLLEAHALGRRVVVIVDEAQNLSPEVLEQVRLLTNLETPTQKLLQIILIGQPELRVLLERNDLRQLAQRITGRYHLSPLSRDESRAYVTHRLRVAGGGGTEIFTLGALAEIHRLSSGIPRVINVCADRALLGAYTRDTRKVTASLVRRAAGEVYGRRFAPAWLGWLAGGVAATALVVALVGIWRYWSLAPERARAQAAAVVAAAAAAKVSLGQAPTDGVTPGSAAGVTPGSATGATAGATAGGTLGAAAAQPPTVAAAGPRASAAAPPVPALGAQLEAHAAETTEGEAYRRLFALWGLTITDLRDPCAQAAKSGLDCFEQRGSWAEVRMLNRPAILTLIDEQGNRHQVVLAALDDHFATLELAGHSEKYPLDEVSRLWFGEFAVAWRPKTRRTRALSVGMSGEEVRWLRRSLNALRGTSANPARADLFDHDLAVAVENFQREHRLNVDGIAGIQTQMVLETALADPNSPFLQSPAARGS